VLGLRLSRHDKGDSSIATGEVDALPALDPQKTSVDTLSARERDVLKLMVDGASNKEISEKLIISVSTVRTHVEHILEKLAVTGRTQAAVKAMKEGLV
jgi:DNA-binding NarL/FixJ family response regulator